MALALVHGLVLVLAPVLALLVPLVGGDRTGLGIPSGEEEQLSYLLQIGRLRVEGEGAKKAALILDIGLDIALVDKLLD